MKFTLKAFFVFCLPLALVISLGLQSQAVEADVKNGAELYKKCAGCHGVKAKFAGKPVEYLNTKMIHYRDGSFEQPKVKAMQKSFSGMSDQDITDLATFVHGM